MGMGVGEGEKTCGHIYILKEKESKRIKTINFREH